MTRSFKRNKVRRGAGGTQIHKKHKYVNMKYTQEAEATNKHNNKVAIKTN